MQKLKEKLVTMESHIASLQHQSRQEDVANSIIHGIGVALSITALVLLVVFGSLNGTAWHVVSFSIFGATLIFLYLSSTLFHGFKNERLVKFFRLFDYSGIFLLIAGTYTPITLILMRNGWGWSLFGVVWGLAVLGIILRFVFPRKIELLLSVLYVIMGWIILIAAKPMFEILPAGFIVWLLIGGASYMLGLVFLSWKRLPFHHAIWHLFVLGGSTAHFFGILFHLAR